MLGSAGHNLKHLLENSRSVFPMSLGMAARTSKAKICTKGSLTRFKFFLGLLYYGTDSSPCLRHPNALSAHPKPWQELPALGHFTHLKDTTSGVCDAQEPLAGVQPGAVPAQGGAEAQEDVCLYAAQHQEAGWEHFTFLERKVC